MKEKIVNILINELCYCYCDNCKYGKFKDRHCDDCHREYQSWKLSTDTAAQIAEQIITEVNNNYYGRI